MGQFDLDEVEAAEVAEAAGEAPPEQAALLDAYRAYLARLDRAHNVRFAAANPNDPLARGIRRHYSLAPARQRRGRAPRLAANTRTRGSRRTTAASSPSRDGPSDLDPPPPRRPLEGRYDWRCWLASRRAALDDEPRGVVLELFPRGGDLELAA